MSAMVLAKLHAGESVNMTCGTLLIASETSNQRKRCLVQRSCRLYGPNGEKINRERKVKRANLSPDSHVIYALCNQNIPWWKAIAELVDNSFDAGATRVVVEAKKRVLTVTDDGRGIRDILSIARLGRHDQHDSTKLGMYGIGAKDAWFSCADILDVETVCDGKRSTLSISLPDLVKNNWECPDPLVSETNAHSGTRITLPLRAGKNMPSADAFNELAFVFTPALQSGCRSSRTLENANHCIHIRCHRFLTRFVLNLKSTGSQ